MNSLAQQTNLLDELHNALAHGTLARRVETLRRVTDLFVHAAIDYSDEQIAVFDDVFHCLIEKIETSAKARLANHLAPIPQAPPKLMYTLAFDDQIEVAAPVLSLSARLDDDMLIENARAKSQGHLLAISKRKSLSGAVTDVLIERGNTEVVESAVKNPGAEFSDDGYSKLVSRADGNDSLATCLGTRKNIPRAHYLKLIARASDTVRARLEAASAQSSDEIATAVQEAAFETGHAVSEIGESTLQAHRLVKSLFDDGRLDEGQIISFAKAAKFDETSAALSLRANVPVATVETMMIESSFEGLMVLGKVIGLSWPTLRCIFAMRGSLSDAEQNAIDAQRSSYDMLRLSTAQQVLRFYRMRQTTGQTS